MLFQSAPGQEAPQSLKEQNELLLQEIEHVHELSEKQAADVRAIFARSRFIGQGNPAVTRHPVSPEQCLAALDETAVNYANPDFEGICGAKYMSPLYDPATSSMEEAEACIDQFEFPNIPCSYPLVWVRAREAAEFCEATGKRLCDAHEWEGACAGALHEPDYRFDLAKHQAPNAAVSRMQKAHNEAQAGKEIWSYGPAYRTGVCAAASSKSPSCDGGGWAACGSNTYPSGYFPECRSTLGIYDLHGNAAEHMNLPLDESQMASRGSRDLGHTEMKGSWFIFDRYRAHPDHCRWRAPYWHGSRVMDAGSHHNYHLGFRCCKTLPTESTSTTEDAQKEKECPVPRGPGTR
jgi:formylglycine-generating enzyme required for sulfatase activity